MATALTIVQMLSAQPDAGGVIASARLPEDAEVSNAILNKASIPDEIEFLGNLCRIALSFGPRTEEFVSDLRKVSDACKMRVELVERVLSDKNYQNFEEAEVFSVEEAIKDLDKEIEVIEENRLKIAPVLNFVSGSYSGIASVLSLVSEALVESEANLKDEIKRHLDFLANYYRKGGEAARDANESQFRYLLQLKMLRGALVTEDKPHPVSSRDEMASFLEEVWA